MRHLGGLALLAPTALALLLLVDPGVLSAWADERAQSAVVALAAGVFGVSVTATIVWLYFGLRLRRLVVAAERIAQGDLDVRLSTAGAGVDGRLARAINAISASVAAKHDAAMTDRLTGVASRQALLAAVFTEVDRARRYGRPFSVAFVDIDHFKTVNDTYGHAAGDAVLRGVAQAIQSNLRQADLIGRYGGEEFMILLAETDVEDAAALAEKLRHLVGRLRFSVDGNSALTVTVSIGIAGGSGDALRTDQLVRDADAAMYSAKALGRNQTYIFAEPDEDARVPRAPISPAGRARANEVGRLAREAAQRALGEVIAPLPHYRGRPSALIASVVVAMAAQLDLPEAEVDRIRVAALLHDVGKVAVPAEILDKPSALTSAEWRSVVQHPRIGQVILEQASALREAVPIILHHHERYSGHGYPFGLRGNEIPLGARIVAIADAYDAMTNDRPYKRALGHEQAVKELRRHAGTQFDPDLVTLFCDLYGDAPPVVDPAILGAFPSALAGHAAGPEPRVPTAPAPRRRRSRETATG